MKPKVIELLNCARAMKRRYPQHHDMRRLMARSLRGHREDRLEQVFCDDPTDQQWVQAMLASGIY